MITELSSLGTKQSSIISRYSDIITVNNSQNDKVISLLNYAFVF